MATRKKKNNIGAFGHPIYGKGFAKYGEMRTSDSLEVPADLEEAAEKYAEDHGFRVPYDGSDNFYDAVDVKASKEGFIHGAEWQKEQDDRLVDIIYQQGIEKGKDEMREQAVSGALAYEPHLRRIIVNLDDIPDGAWNGGGTPVEVIIFKKEQVTKEN